MPLLAPTRRAYTSVLAGLMLAVLHLSADAQPPKAGPSAPPPPPRVEWQRPPGMNHPGSGPHLKQWMQSHSNLTPEQQQQALEREPGFRSLPPETQQRLRNHLTQLNNMSPQQRQRLLDHNEAMARLSPPQRQQVREAVKQFASLPPDRRHEVARTFRQLRDMPEPQRQALLDSESYRGRFTPQERDALSGLFSVESYHVIMPNRKAEESPER
jgi:DNA-directed RNA polymerase subunit F